MPESIPESIPEKKKRPPEVRGRVDPPLKQALEIACTCLGITQNDALVIAIKNWLEANRAEIETVLAARKQPSLESLVGQTLTTNTSAAPLAPTPVDAPTVEDQATLTIASLVSQWDIERLSDVAHIEVKTLTDIANGLYPDDDALIGLGVALMRANGDAWTTEALTELRNHTFTAHGPQREVVENGV